MTEYVFDERATNEIIDAVRRIKNEPYRPTGDTALVHDASTPVALFQLTTSLTKQSGDNEYSATGSFVYWRDGSFQSVPYPPQQKLWSPHGDISISSGSRVWAVFVGRWQIIGGGGNGIIRATLMENMLACGVATGKQDDGTVVNLIDKGSIVPSLLSENDGIHWYMPHGAVCYAVDLGETISQTSGTSETQYEPFSWLVPCPEEGSGESGESGESIGSTESGESGEACVPATYPLAGHESNYPVLTDPVAIFGVGIDCKGNEYHGLVPTSACEPGSGGGGSGGGGSGGNIDGGSP